MNHKILIFLSSLVYSAPVPFDLLKYVVAPLAVATSFSNLGNLPSRSIVSSQNQIHSQITKSNLNPIAPPRDLANIFRTTPKMIVGGETVSISQYPFYMFVHSGKGNGGGTLIAPNIMLTAAHVTGDITDLESKRVVQYRHDNLDGFDPSKLHESEIVYRVVKIIQHPNYKFFKTGDDIALWFLEVESNPLNRDLSIVYPELSFGEPYDSSMKLTAVGFGKTSFEGVRSQFLQKIDARIVSNEEASARYNSFGGKEHVFDDRTICIDSFDEFGNHQSVMPGDSGGPLLKSIDGKIVLIGISSWGSANPRYNRASVFTKVSAYNQWIKETIKGYSKS